MMLQLAVDAVMMIATESVVVKVAVTVLIAPARSARQLCRPAFPWPPAL